MTEEIQTFKMRIGDAWCMASESEWLETRNPVTGRYGRAFLAARPPTLMRLLRLRVPPSRTASGLGLRLARVVGCSPS